MYELKAHFLSEKKSDWILQMNLWKSNHCKYNEIWWDCQQSERVSAIKPGLIHQFLHLKMPVPSQEYDNSCLFFFDVFCYLILPCVDGLFD